MLGRLTQETNPETGTTYYVYDADTTCTGSYSAGNMVKRTDAVGNVTSRTDTAGRVTNLAYDNANRLVRKTDTMGPGTTDDIINVSGYDEVGNLTYRKDPANFETKTRYDAAKHIVETVAPNGSHSYVPGARPIHRSGRKANGSG